MKIQILFCVILTIVVAAGCSNKTFSNGDKWIPADFHASSTTLLIIRFGNEKEYQAAQTFVKENYPHPHQFTYLLDTAKFTDVKKFRWVVLEEHVDMTPNRPTYPHITGIDYYLYDRLERRSYPVTKRASSTYLMTFRPFIRTISVKQ